MNNCSSGSSAGSSTTNNGSKQATPFNIGTFGVLFVFCIIIALTSSLYHNWPAVERILIDDKVFQNLCTKDEIYNAINGMFICDKQRKQINNLALIIFYSEFIAFAIGGILADIVGVKFVLILSFLFGLMGFAILYFCYFSNRMIKLAFSLWGMFGGFIFITSVQFPKMLPDATSLADGLIIMFDNISNLIPIIIYKIMKNFNLKYYEAFGTYILWGVFQAFILTLCFIPNRIINVKNGSGGTQTSSSNNGPFDFSCLSKSLKDQNLWLNYIIFSIPITCSIFYKKTFSTYFLKNQTLVNIFPIIMLFVFIPTIFIAALNQFMGVHITSSILYIFYIISFICFLYPTKNYGLLSIILFVISTSAAEQQIMTYINENHQQNESTLLGISYAVDFIVGSILQRIFTCIFDRSPISILYIIIPLFFICICYSLYCATGECKSTSTSQNGTNHTSFKGLFIIFWFIPFLFLFLRLSFNYFKSKKQVIDDMPIDKSQISNYTDEKITIVSIMFYSFTFYYVCDSFLIINSIIKFIYIQPFSDHKHYGLFYFLSCFYIIPQPFIFILFRQGKKRYFSLLNIITSIFVLKVGLFVFSNLTFNKTVTLVFSIFLMIYGFVFFSFIYMLAYYNFQITYVDRCYKTSLLHWGSMTSVFILFKLFYNILNQYELAYYILWVSNICFFIYFIIIIYFYIPYEMDIKFNFNSSNLPVPIFSKFKQFTTIDFKDPTFYCNIATVSLSIWSFAVLTNLNVNNMFIYLLISSLYDVTVVVLKILFQENSQCNEYLKYSLTGFSVVLFLIFLLIRSFSRDNNYEERSFLVFLRYLNMVVILLSSNVFWLSIQNELQKCCCNGRSSCCKCCCTCKPLSQTCSCCKDNTKCCCCCKPKENGCTCDPQCCQHCSTRNCKDCVCRCLKKFKHANDSPAIIFCFYGCNFEKVDKIFFEFYLGTIIGWLAFIIYLNISRVKIL